MVEIGVVAWMRYVDEHYKLKCVVDEIASNKYWGEREWWDAGRENELRKAEEVETN